MGVALLLNILHSEPSLQGYVYIYTDRSSRIGPSKHFYRSRLWSEDYTQPILRAHLAHSECGLYVTWNSRIWMYVLLSYKRLRSHMTSYSVGAGESLAFPTLGSLGPSTADRCGADKSSIQDYERVWTSETIPWHWILLSWSESYGRRRSLPLHARSKRPSDVLLQVLRSTTPAHGLLMVTKRFGNIQTPARAAF